MMKHHRDPTNALYALPKLEFFGEKNFTFDALVRDPIEAIRLCKALQ
jgi:hypothetical protein